MGIIEGEGDEGVVELGGFVAVATGGDEEVLAAGEGVGHGGGLGGDGEIVLPELLAGGGVEGPDLWVFGGGGEDEAGGGDDGAAEVGDAGVEAGDGGAEGLAARASGRC